MSEENKLQDISINNVPPGEPHEEDTEFKELFIEFMLLIGDQIFHVSNIVHLVILAIRFVESLNKLNGKEKKNMAIRLVKEKVDSEVQHSSISGNEKQLLIMFVSNVLPFAIDSIVKIANEGLKFVEEIEAKCSDKLHKLFPCIYKS